MIRNGMGPAGPSMAMVCARGLRGISGNGPSPWRRRSRTKAGGTDHRVRQSRELGHDIGILGADLVADGGRVEEGGIDHASLGVVAFVAGALR